MKSHFPCRQVPLDRQTSSSHSLATSLHCDAGMKISAMYRWRRISRVALTVALALTTLASDALFSQGRPASRRIVMLDGREVIEGEVIVRYRSQTGSLERQRAEIAADSDASEAIGQRGVRRVRSRNLTTRQMLATLSANPDVEFVEPNYVIRAASLPNDTSFASQWGLRNTGQVVEGQTGIPGADINAPAAWDITTGSRANIVAVLDTGIDFNHPDLAANVFSAPRAFTVTLGSVTVQCGAGTHGFNALTNLCVPFDDNGHGTHVSGIIGAVGNNNTGITGVNWTANIMALKVLGPDGTGSTSDAIKAIDFAIQTKAALGTDGNVRILNASWGGTTFSQALDDEIQAANNADMLLVAAAGTDGRNIDVTPHYPAASTRANVVSVAAADNRGELAPFSNYGATSVDIAAPGASTLSTLPNNGYGELSGTSMAAPFVSGAAALVLSRCPSTTAALKTTLLSSAFPVASMTGKSTSGGRLDVNAALTRCASLPGAASMTVNGTTGALTVAPGAVMSVAVSNNGPADPWDYLMVAPVGAPANYWSGVFQFLNGTTTLPASPIRNAIVSVRAPTTPGTYEVRFNAAGQFGRLATSGVITVGTPSDPPPPPPPPPPSSSTSMTVNGTTGALSVAPGAAMTVAVTNGGTADVWDYVMVAPVGAPANYWSGVFQFLNGTTTLPAAPITNATISVRAPTTPGTYEVRYNAAGQFNRLATSGVITVSSSEPPPPPPPPPASASMMVNGTTGALTVAPGAAMTVAVTNSGTADVWDYVMVAPVGAPANYWSGVFQFLNGTTTLPAAPITNATISVRAPTTPGTYEVRFNAAGQFNRLATSGVITVSSSEPPPPPPPPPPSSSASMTVNGTTGALTVAPGATMTVVVTNSGTADVWDYVMVAPVGAAANYWTRVFQFLNGTTTLPTTPITSATIGVRAPTTPGTYEVRFNAAGQFNRLATSGVITVSSSAPPPPPPSSSASMTVNGTTGALTVAPGATMTVVVTNGGTADVWDYVMVAPVGAAANYWTGVFQFLNGTTTLPAAPITNATISVRAPTTPGSYEVRYNAAGQFGRLATSGVITVQ